jgi:3-oxoacyl-ACP reductase-like protein
MLKSPTFGIRLLFAYIPQARLLTLDDGALSVHTTGRMNNMRNDWHQSIYTKHLLTNTYVVTMSSFGGSYDAFC